MAEIMSAVASATNLTNAKEEEDLSDIEFENPVESPFAGQEDSAKDHSETQTADVSESTPEENHPDPSDDPESTDGTFDKTPEVRTKSQPRISVKPRSVLPVEDRTSTETVPVKKVAEPAIVGPAVTLANNTEKVETGEQKEELKPSTPSTATTELAIPAPEYDFFSKVIHSVVGMTRANAYDLCISHVTKVWYKVMLEELEPGAVVLDVGIGTATPLIQNKDLLIEKNIRVIGIDNDVDYIESSKLHISKAKLDHRIRVYHHNIYKMDELKGKLLLPRGDEDFTHALTEEVLFDAIFFSGTLPVLHDKVGAINGLASWRKPKCKIMVCQAAQYESLLTPLARVFKPMLYYLTSVDHGELITEEEAVHLFELTIRRECKLDVTHHESLESYNNPLEAAYFTILEPMSERDRKAHEVADRIK